MAATDAGAIADEVHPLLRAVPHAFLGLSPLFPTLCWVILLCRTFVWRTSMEMQCSSSVGARPAVHRATRCPALRSPMQRIPTVAEGRKFERSERHGPSPG